MNTRRAVIAVSFIAFASVVYYLTLVWAVTLLAMPPVTNQAPESASRLLLMSLKHGGAVIAASIPFVIAIRALRLERPFVAAISIALLGGALPFIASVLLSPSPYAWWVDLADTIKLGLALPLLTWLAYRLVPSNNSFKPTPLRGAA